MEFNPLRGLLETVVDSKIQKTLFQLLRNLAPFRKAEVNIPGEKASAALLAGLARALQPYLRTAEFRDQILAAFGLPESPVDDTGTEVGAEAEPGPENDTTLVGGRRRFINALISGEDPDSATPDLAIALGNPEETGTSLDDLKLDISRALQEWTKLRSHPPRPTSGGVSVDPLRMSIRTISLNERMVIKHSALTEYLTGVLEFLTEDHFPEQDWTSVRDDITSLAVRDHSEHGGFLARAVAERADARLEHREAALRILLTRQTGQLGAHFIVDPEKSAPRALLVDFLRQGNLPAELEAIIIGALEESITTPARSRVEQEAKNWATELLTLHQNGVPATDLNWDTLRGAVPVTTMPAATE